MITLKKIAIYKEYFYDIKALGRSKEDLLLMEDDWEVIDNLIQDLIIVTENLASDSFEAQTMARLAEACDNEQTQQALIAAAKDVPNWKNPYEDLNFSWSDFWKHIWSYFWKRIRGRKK